MVSFSSLWHDSGPENHLTSFKMHFLAKSPGVNGLRNSLIRPTILEKPTVTLSFQRFFYFLSYFLFYLLLVFSLHFISYIRVVSVSDSQFGVPGSSPTLVTCWICSQSSRVQILSHACKLANWLPPASWGF